MNQIVLWKDMTLFWGSNSKAISEHRHPSIQLVLAVQNSFSSKNINGEWVEKTGLLITPNYFHECDAKNIQILSIDIEPESALGEWILKHQLSGQKIIDFPLEPKEGFNFEELSLYFENKEWNKIRAIIENSFLYQHSYDPSQKDDRIENVLNFISNNINKPINTKKTG